MQTMLPRVPQSRFRTRFECVARIFVGLADRDLDAEEGDEGIRRIRALPSLRSFSDCDLLRDASRDVSSLYSKRFAAFLKRSPDTATSEDNSPFPAAAFANRNRTMTGLRFLFRVTLRRPDLATDTYHIKEPQLCGVRHKIGYADRRTMPNGHVFPRIRGDWHMTDSA